jgi:hypothetical protein
MASPTISLDHVAQDVEKQAAVAITGEDRRASVAPRSEVVQRPRKLDAKRSRHAADASPEAGQPRTALKAEGVRS